MKRFKKKVVGFINMPSTISLEPLTDAQQNTNNTLSENPRDLVFVHVKNLTASETVGSKREETNYEIKEKNIKVVYTEKLKKDIIIKYVDGIKHINEYVCYRELEEKYLDEQDNYINLPELNINYNQDTSQYIVEQKLDEEQQNISRATRTFPPIPPYNYKKYTQSLTFQNNYTENIFEATILVSIYKGNQLLSSQNVVERYNNVDFDTLSKHSIKNAIGV